MGRLTPLQNLHPFNNCSRFAVALRGGGRSRSAYAELLGAFLSEKTLDAEIYVTCNAQVISRVFA